MTGSRDRRLRLLATLVLIACVVLLVGAEEPSGCSKGEEERASQEALDYTGADETTTPEPEAERVEVDMFGNPVIMLDDLEGETLETADGRLTVYGAWTEALKSRPATTPAKWPYRHPYIVGWNLQNVDQQGGGDPAVVDMGDAESPDDGILRVTITSGVVKTEEISWDEAFVDLDGMAAFPGCPNSPELMASIDHDCPTLENVVVSGWTPIREPAVMVIATDPGCFPDGAQWWYDALGDPLDQSAVDEILADMPF